MRRNSSTVVVLAGPVPAEVLAAVGRSMNVNLIRPAEPAGRPAGQGGRSAESGGSGTSGRDGIEAAAEALGRAARSTAPYALVPADPLAAVAASWQAMWDVSRQPGPLPFEQEAARALAAWRAGQFELPDYYLALAAAEVPVSAPAGADSTERGPDFYLGPLRSARPHRVAVVAAAEPAQQAAGVLTALGSLRHGPWWPGLDEVLEAARTFYPGRLAEAALPQ